MVGNGGDVVEDEGFCMYLGGAAGTLERVSIEVDSPVLVSWYVAGTKVSSAMCSCCTVSLDCGAPISPRWAIINIKTYPRTQRPFHSLCHDR